jgi:hypothetical protein
MVPQSPLAIVPRLAPAHRSATLRLSAAREATSDVNEGLTDGPPNTLPRMVHATVGFSRSHGWAADRFPGSHGPSGRVRMNG